MSDNKIDLYKTGILSRILKTDGKGNKYLSDNGEYKNLNTFNVETINDMNNIIGMKDGDICTVNKYIIQKNIQMNDNLNGKTIYFKDLNDILTETYYEEQCLKATNNTKTLSITMDNVYGNSLSYTLNGNTTILSEIVDHKFVNKDCNFVVSGDYIVDKIKDDVKIYSHMFVENIGKYTFRYDLNTKEWINIEINQSVINGNISKGDEEIVVYRPNRKNHNYPKINDTNHTVTLTLDNYDSKICIPAYNDSNGYTQLYKVILSEDIYKNISSCYQISAYIDFGSITFNPEYYNYITLRVEEEGNRDFDYEIGVNDINKKIYIHLNNYYDGFLYKPISFDEYSNITNGIQCVKISCDADVNHPYIKIDYNGNKLLKSNDYNRGRNVVISLDLDGKYIAYNKIDYDINNLSSSLSKNRLNILYVSDNTTALSDIMESKLEELGCSKYKTVTSLTNYILICLNGQVYEYVSDSKMYKNFTFLVDEKYKNLMLVSNKQEVDLSDVNNSIATLNGDIGEINKNINNTIEQTGVLWMGKFGITEDDINFTNISRVDVDKLDGTSGSLTVSNKIVTFTAPYNGTYAFRGRCNFTNSTTNGSITVNINSGYLLKETNISSKGGDTRQFYMNLPMNEGNTAKISVLSSSTIGINNIFLEISRY